MDTTATRAVLYASDPVECRQQNLQNQILRRPVGYTPSSVRRSDHIPNTMITNLLNTSTGFAPINRFSIRVNAVRDLWPEFKVDSTGTKTWLIAPNTPAGSQPTCTPAISAALLLHHDECFLYYPIKLSHRQSRANEQNTVENEPYSHFQINPVTSQKRSFAAYDIVRSICALQRSFVAGRCPAILLE